MDINEVDLCLREITVDDISTIVEIERELFSDPWDPIVFYEELNSKETFFKEIKGKKLSSKHNYLLELNGEIVGFFLGWAIYDEYSIMNIGVSKKYQKSGLGSFLLNSLLEKAVELECFIVYLEVRASNLPAIKLYEKYKFENIGIRKNYYQNPVEDGVLMKLALVDHETMMDSLLKSIMEM